MMHLGTVPSLVHFMVRPRTRVAEAAGRPAARRPHRGAEAGIAGRLAEGEDDGQGGGCETGGQQRPERKPR